MTYIKASVPFFEPVRFNFDDGSLTTILDGGELKAFDHGDSLIRNRGAFRLFNFSESVFSLGRNYRSVNVLFKEKYCVSVTKPAEEKLPLSSKIARVVFYASAALPLIALYNISRGNSSATSPLNIGLIASGVPFLGLLAVKLVFRAMYTFYESNKSEDSPERKLGGNGLQPPPDGINFSPSSPTPQKQAGKGKKPFDPTKTVRPNVKGKGSIQPGKPTASSSSSQLHGILKQVDKDKEQPKQEKKVTFFIEGEIVYPDHSETVRYSLNNLTEIVRYSLNNLTEIVRYNLNGKKDAQPGETSSQSSGSSSPLNQTSASGAEKSSDLPPFHRSKMPAITGRHNPKLLQQQIAQVGTQVGTHQRKKAPRSRTNNQQPGGFQLPPPKASSTRSAQPSNTVTINPRLSPQKKGGTNANYQTKQLFEMP